MNMGLKIKTIAFFLLVVLINAIGFGITGYQINQVTQELKESQENSLPMLLTTSKVAFNIATQAAEVRGFIAAGTQEMLFNYQRLSIENTKLEEDLLANAKTEEDQQLVAELKALNELFDRIAGEKVIPLRQLNKEAEAIQIMEADLTPVTVALLNKTGEYINFREQHIHTAFNTMIKTIQTTQAIALALSFLSVILGILIGFLSARAITRPLTALVDTARNITDGNLQQQVQVNRQDEIGELQTAFGTMVSHLRTVVSTVQENARQVAAASSELTANAGQSAEAVNQVAAAITNVACGAEQQLSAINETTAVVEQMSAGIQQIAASANAVSASSEQTAGAALEGQKAIDTAIEQMNSIKVTVERSARVVAKLGDHSQEIGQIVATISSIAGQTNLLALNAAIEAARAGEQGRGFAVVAEEVRKLAEQSQEAAKHIAALISEIQADTNQAVVAMESGNQEVNVGTEVIGTAGRNFHEITTGIHGMSAQIREISAAVQEMAGGSGQIVSSVRTIDRISQDTFGHTQTVSAAIQQQSASMEEIAASSGFLAKMSQELQNSIQRFRL
ncbi:methyl-accepting chemotaxis protein [Sporomusa sp. GT1]|uniref:methyl-accepting chemotaxis protein n=1 Tax=Sporomusa sp. GT1 TaxID=1534747 RepID=UPI00166A61A4|nr:methyl-accepting chemotaxis protein [Sporomusa sp. GT1]